MKMLTKMNFAGAKKVPKDSTDLSKVCLKSFGLSRCGSCINNKKCIDGANVNYAKRCKDYKKSARTAGTVADGKQYIKHI